MTGLLLRLALAVLLIVSAALPAVAQNQVVPPQAAPANAAAPAPVAPAQTAQAPTAPTAPRARTLTDLPIETGLPLVVRTGLGYIQLDGIDENAETYTGTVDLRLSWVDPRLRYPAAETPIGYREWRGEAVAPQLATMWSPRVTIANLQGEPSRQNWSLRLFPNGRVELLRRVTGTFAAPFDVQRFPFDRQALPVELVSQRETADKVLLDYRQDDLAFSRADPGIEIDGWRIGSVNLQRIPLPGWYGESYARLQVALEIDRRPIETVPGLFVPLLASLLIPLLATWLNRSNNGEFEIEAFELTNIIIGGLFAVIALSFTVNSERSHLAAGLNTVSLLFGLNFLSLGIALVINVVLIQFNAARAFAGRHVQHELFQFVTWAFPVAVAASAIALILLAAA